MEPTQTNQTEAVTWKGREDEAVGRIEDLEAVRGDDGALYSCWKPDWREKFALMFGSPVVVGVLAQRQPPICVKVGRGNIPTKPTEGGEGRP